MELRSSAAMSAYARASAHSTVAMVSLRAPAAVDSQRAPLDILCVIDKSGSMNGEKMALMKQTLALLVSRAGLSPADRVAIVSFSSDAHADLPLTVMDAAGLTQAKKVVDRLSAGGGTNLSGGLLLGLQMLVSSAGGADATGAAAAATATRCVLLFTDGQANGGITDPAALVAATQGALTGSPTQIFTFGFGSCHNEDLLLSLSRKTLGQYYFLKDAEAIPAAFADCLGGLVSIVAQNATLELKPTGGRDPSASLGPLLGDAYASTSNEDSSVTVCLGDLFSEDEKDVLLKLELPAIVAGAAVHDPVTAAVTATVSVEGWTLIDRAETNGGEAVSANADSGVTSKPAAAMGMEQPAMAAAAATDSVVVLQAKLSYFSVVTKRFEEAHAQLSLSRPEDATAVTVNHTLDEHANRLAVAAAIKQATHLADRGNVAEGRAVLDAAIGALQRSPSADSSVSQALITDIQRLARDYEHISSYRAVGSKRSKMSAMTHSYQRSTHDEEMPSSYSAGASSKGSMKRGWTTI
mmetsp:Transcript_81114/g.161287  ORF Transcript_81114/g.161287 Transcript_81114/m.161287 type:complete len:524 (-) Transcript_81114:555-2126(-)